MSVYTVSLSLSTDDECASADEAAEYFAAAVSAGLTVTGSNDETGISEEVDI